MIKVEVIRPVLTEEEKKIRYKQIEAAIVVIAKERDKNAQRRKAL